MSERTDIRELRLLIVGGKAHAAHTLRTVLGIAGAHYVVSAGDSEFAIELLRSHKFDAIFVDENAKPVDKLPFYLAARRGAEVRNPLIPLFLVCASPSRRFVETVRDRGVTDVIVRPMSAAVVLRKLRTALEFPRAFIKSHDFFGPDRRAATRINYSGKDRRGRMARKLKVQLAEAQAIARADNKDIVML